MERVELEELLGLCFKEQGFINNSLSNKVSRVSDTIYSAILEDKNALKSVLERMGKALIDASEHIK